jgi:hypothetical protein
MDIFHSRSRIPASHFPDRDAANAKNGRDILLSKEHTDYVSIMVTILKSFAKHEERATAIKARNLYQLAVPKQARNRTQNKTLDIGLRSCSFGHNSAIYRAVWNPAALGYGVALKPCQRRLNVDLASGVSVRLRAFKAASHFLRELPHEVWLT